MIKVIVVEDDELQRFSIVTAIKAHPADFCVVGEAESGAELFALLAGITPDIISLDIKLPDISGIDIARRLKRERPEIKILALSFDNDTSTVQAMLDTGIDGFLSKSKGVLNHVVEALHSIMQGMEYFGSDISQIIYRIYVAKAKRTKDSMEERSEFTPQEKRIIELCHEKLPGKLIADRLGITLSTVNNHKNNIFRKFGFNSTAEMVHYAINHGIIQM